MSWLPSQYEFGLDDGGHLKRQIEEYCNEVKGRGVRIIVDIKCVPSGIRGFAIEDIDGYKLISSLSASLRLSVSILVKQSFIFGG